MGEKTKIMIGDQVITTLVNTTLNIPESESSNWAKIQKWHTGELSEAIAPKTYEVKMKGYLRRNGRYYFRNETQQFSFDSEKVDVQTGYKHGDSCTLIFNL